MPAVTLVGHKCTGHDDCPPVPLIEGSKTFTVNGKPVGLVGHKYEIHSCPVHGPHQGFIAEGSSSFKVEGKAVGRVGDKVSCGGTIAEGYDGFNIG